MNKSMKLIGIGIALALAGALAGAADAPTAPEVTVSYGDLNLERAAGAARLYGRIQLAARIVCGSEGEKELARAMQQRSCVKETISRAVASVGAPKLTQYHESRMGQQARARFVARKD